MKLATKLALGAAGIGLIAGAPVVCDEWPTATTTAAVITSSASSGSPTTSGSCRSEAKPWRTRNLSTISGLVDDTSVVGIDYRPATGDRSLIGDKGASRSARGPARPSGRGSTCPSEGDLRRRLQPR